MSTKTAAAKVRGDAQGAPAAADRGRLRQAPLHAASLARRGSTTTSRPRSTRRSAAAARATSSGARGGRSRVARCMPTSRPRSGTRARSSTASSRASGGAQPRAPGRLAELLRVRSGARARPDGLSVNTSQLRNGVLFDIENQRYEGVLRPVATRTRPKVTTSQLARRYPRVIIINRSELHPHAVQEPQELQVLRDRRRAGRAGVAARSSLGDRQDGRPHVVRAAGRLGGQPRRPGRSPAARRTIPSRRAGSVSIPVTGSMARPTTRPSAPPPRTAASACTFPDVEDLYHRVQVGDPVYVI